MTSKRQKSLEKSLQQEEEGFATEPQQQQIIQQVYSIISKFTCTQNNMKIDRTLIRNFCLLLYLAVLASGFAPISTQSRSVRTSSELHLGDFFNFGKKETSDKEEKESEVAKVETEKEVYIDDDPVEKLFNIFFGQKEEAPMGMARFGSERFPEQYPAVKDEWAEPVETDDKEMQIIRPFLKNTNLERRGLKLSYDANRDGWDPIVFHQLVDKKGGAVVLCETRMGIVCGGYNPKGKHFHKQSKRILLTLGMEA